MENIFDLVVIGGGPTGLSCAIAARQKGLSCIVLEKGTLVNSIYRFPANMTFFSTSLNLEIGNIPFVSHADKPSRREALEYYRRVYQTWDLDVRMYEAATDLLPGSDGAYRVVSSHADYQCRNVVVATGFYDVPRRLNVPGEDLPKVRHFYDEAHPYIGQQVLVVGAANSACDVALETFQKGARVTMAIREEAIYEKVKYWIRPNIENRIKEGSIRAYFSTTVKEIRNKSVRLQTPDGEISLPNDFVLAMTGYQPDYDLLRHLGIVILPDEARQPAFDGETFETNLPGVYVAGVVQAGLHTGKLFIENTRHHGDRIVGHILRRRLSDDSGARV
ncbi:MAG: hypothetical protein RLY31_650 [Bacteroidota bacterium]|jgi:thioredoxin reductase (NADPH)